jgi:hypothetical protein
MQQFPPKSRKPPFVTTRNKEDALKFYSKEAKLQRVQSDFVIRKVKLN